MHVWSSWFWTLAFQAGQHAGSNPVTCSICPWGWTAESPPCHGGDSGVSTRLGRFNAVTLVEADIPHKDIVISSNLIAAIKFEKGRCNIMLRLLRLLNLRLAGNLKLNMLCTCDGIGRHIRFKLWCYYGVWVRLPLGAFMHPWWNWHTYATKNRSFESSNLSGCTKFNLDFFVYRVSLIVFIICFLSVFLLDIWRYFWYTNNIKEWKENCHEGIYNGIVNFTAKHSVQYL